MDVGDGFLRMDFVWPKYDYYISLLFHLCRKERREQIAFAIKTVSYFVCVLLYFLGKKLQNANLKRALKT